MFGAFNNRWVPNIINDNIFWFAFKYEFDTLLQAPEFDSFYHIKND